MAETSNPDLEPEPPETLAENVENTEITEGARSVFLAIHKAMSLRQGLEPLQENDAVPDITTYLAAEIVKSLLEKISPPFLAALNTGNVDGLTEAELNAALEQVFLAGNQTLISEEGIKSAEIVMDELGIGSGDLSFKAQVGLSGLLSEMHNMQTPPPPMFFRRTPGRDPHGLRPIPPDAHDAEPESECDRTQQYGPGEHDPSCMKI